MKLLKLIATVTAIATVLAVTSVGAEAQTVNQRLRDQHAREAQGIRTGELTRHEARRVRSSDRRIHLSEFRDRTMHGGHLTMGERTRLNNRLNRNSARICRLKHNARVRPNG
jgi:hypothetical protein